MFLPARLVYFAEAARSTETTEEPRSEKKDDPLTLEKKVTCANQIENETRVIGREGLASLRGKNFENFVQKASLNELEKVLEEAKELAALRGKADKLVTKLLTSEHLSAAARNRLKKLGEKAGIGKVKDLAAFRELAVQAEAQVARLPLAAAATHEFKRLARLAGAELFADIKITVKSESGGDQTLTGLISAKDFRDLSLSQKNSYLQAVRDKLAAGGTTAAALAAAKLRDELLADPATPESWSEYLKNPAEYGHTLEYAANWVDENLGPLVVSTENYRQLTQQVGRYPQGTEKLAALGVRLESVDDFQTRSRHERDEYLTEVGEALAQIDANLAADAAAAGSRSAAESRGLADQLEKQEAEEDAVLAQNLTTVAQRVKNSTAYTIFRDKQKIAEAEALDLAQEQAKLQQAVQARRGAAEGGVLGALAQKFGFKNAAANAATFDEAEVRERATKNTVDSFLADEVIQKEVDAALGLDGLQPAERAQLVKLLFTRSENDLAANDHTFFLRTKNDQILMQTIRSKTNWTQAKVA